VASATQFNDSWFRSAGRQPERGMIFELIGDTTKLALIVACLYFALGAYAKTPNEEEITSRD
jgi:hypothetical protein